MIAPKDAVAGCKLRGPSTSGQVEYAWLCSCCSLYLTIQIDEELGTGVVRKFEAKNGSEFVMPANERNRTDIA